MPQRSNLFKSHWSNQWLTFCAVIMLLATSVPAAGPKGHLLREEMFDGISLRNGSIQPAGEAA